MNDDPDSEDPHVITSSTSKVAISSTVPNTITVTANEDIFGFNTTSVAEVGKAV